MTDPILLQRARELARPVGTEAPHADETAVLVFRRSNDRYAVALGGVLDVQRGPPLTLIPGAGAPVLGVIAWRGRVLTVVDVAAGGPVGDDWRAVVIGNGRARVAIFADTIDDTRSVGAHQLRPLEEDARQSGEGAVPFTGVTSDAVLMLDVDTFLRRYTG